MDRDEIVFEQYYEDVYRFLRALTRDRDLAEELTQETFLRLLRTDTPFEGEEHVRRWLVHVAINEAKRLCRSPWRRHTEPLSELKTAENFADEEQRALFEAVMELPRKYRVPLYLYYYEGYAAKEVAALLGRSPSTVQTWLARGRDQLKQKLKEDWSDD